MKLLLAALPCAAIAFSTGVNSEVLAKDRYGFISEHKLVLNAPPALAYRALVEDIHLWWDAAHSYGGNAMTFSIDATAGGCFCEQLGDGGSVEHMRVVNAVPGAALILHGGLGPLQSMGVSGSMTFQFSAHDAGSLLTYRYAVGGYAPGGLEPLAGPVDQVQLGQLERLRDYLATGEALND